MCKALATFREHNHIFIMSWHLEGQWSLHLLVGLFKNIRNLKTPSLEAEKSRQVGKIKVPTLAFLTLGSAGREASVFCSFPSQWFINLSWFRCTWKPSYEYRSPGSKLWSLRCWVSLECVYLITFPVDSDTGNLRIVLWGKETSSMVNWKIKIPSGHL